MAALIKDNPVTMYEVGHATAAGPGRPFNQDSILVYVRDGGPSSPSWLLAAVADGLGGEPGGELASEIAVTTLERELATAMRIPDHASIVRAFLCAHARIRSESGDSPVLDRMGTTLAAVVAADDLVFVANVGDSRVYTVNAAGIRQLTTDHNVVGEQVLAGVLSAEEALNSPMRNMLTRFLGVRDEVSEVDVFPAILGRAERIVICSDGVHAVLPRQEIRRIAIDGSCQEAAQGLVSASHAAGGADDSSAIVLSPKRKGSM